LPFRGYEKDFEQALSAPFRNDDQVARDVIQSSGT
jgi:hypothetical protein